MAAERPGFEPGLQILQLALGAAAREHPALQRGDPGRIIAAITQPLKRIHQLLRDPERVRECRHAAMRFNIPKSPKILPKQRHAPLTGKAAATYSIIVAHCDSLKRKA